MLLNRLELHLRSPAGCDGGNLAGANWLFGIEYGGASDSLANLASWMKGAPRTTSEHRVADGDVEAWVRAYPFNRSIAKLEAVKHGWKPEEYVEFARASRMFTDNSQFFKGNVGLFSFPKDNEETFAPFRDLLGLASKRDLQAFEIKHRAPMFQDWLRRYRPSCVTCFGTGNADRFLQAFGDPNAVDGWSRLEISRYYHSVVNGGRTHLFILPHATGGRYGLTAHRRLKAFGGMMRETLLAAGVELPTYR